MEPHDPLPPARDKLLFTPGPLTTSLGVKQAMLHDAGSWHFEFNRVVTRIREKLRDLSGAPAASGLECVLMQGSGTFGVESVVTSVVPPRGKLLVVSNGAYGERIGAIAKAARIPHEVLRFPEEQIPRVEDIDRALAADPVITNVAAVHCETTTGILNPLLAIGRTVRRRGRVFIADAMSSFGAVPIDFEGAGIDYLISSANKCIEGVPGFSFILCRRERLMETAGWARSHSLDLHDQWRGFEKNGQFRFTPPTHALLAFDRALRELEEEGGIAARGARYAANHQALVSGAAALGFEPLLEPEVRSAIITAFRYPIDARFRFDDFYRLLSDRGMIIYPGKLTKVDTFRIGTIGRIFPPDIVRLLSAMEAALRGMNCKIPVR